MHFLNCRESCDTFQHPCTPFPLLLSFDWGVSNVHITRAAAGEQRITVVYRGGLVYVRGASGRPCKSMEPPYSRHCSMCLQVLLFKKEGQEEKTKHIKTL